MLVLQLIVLLAYNLVIFLRAPLGIAVLGVMGVLEVLRPWSDIAGVARKDPKRNG